MKYAAISLNFDSLGEAYGWPEGYRDPTFFEVADRFFEISKRYNFKYSIYVIGKDLENSDNRERVRIWAEAGHEIGNHSWEHRMDLAVLPRSAMYKDIKRAHDIISQSIGKDPKGFISPAWNTSSVLYEVLRDLGYEYDTSAFPSWIMFPAMAKNLYNHLGNEKFWKILKRKDFTTLLCGARHAHQRNGVTVLPMPIARMRIACWHTLGFTLGWKLQERILRSGLQDVNAFYYLIHPADLMNKRDLDPTRKAPLERLGTPLEEKIARLEQAIETILASGRKIVTVEELAKQYAPSGYAA